MRINEFSSSFIKIHVLHHCLKEDVYGAWLMEELRRHDYKISPGSLYPLLRSLEKKGLVNCKEHQEGKVKRKMYRITAQGKRELSEAKWKLRQLIGEILD